MAVIRKSSKQSFKKMVRKCMALMAPSNIQDFLLNPARISKWLAIALLLVEVVVNLVVIFKVKYTEIDWVAYMQEVDGVVGENRTLDYSQLRGDTGPLVYPAGFVWFYAVLYYLTNHGDNIRLAQYFFAAIYLLMVMLVFRLLVRTKKVPNLALVIISATSYRIHSICVLRLFNDPVAMLFLYAAFNAFADDKWSLGSFFYSLAVSIKMNILLFAPALFLAYLATQGLWGTFKQLVICAGVQVVLALPFLATHPLNYLIGAFNLGRVFMFKWTVNWRFVPEDVFVSRQFHVALLLLHVVCLALMAKQWWDMLRTYAGQDRKSLHLLLLPLYTCNFVGVACARSLHYQFYVWYYHQLQFLSWHSAPKWTALRLLILGVIEMCWNTYPSTALSSGALHLCHALLFIGLAANSRKFDPKKSE